MKLIINTDGGARGNPGPGAIGVVIKDSAGKKIADISKYIGFSTNNEAEYKAMIEGLKQAGLKNAVSILFNLDSELVVKQMKGLYKVKDAKLKVLHSEAKKLEKNFEHVEYNHVPRTQNSEADALVNQVLDERGE
jgi:ribonuclease HI